MNLITYGLGDYFDKSKFIKVKNNGRKPTGGLWSSPLKSKCGWKQWCITENYYLKAISESSFTFSLDPSCMFLVIDSVEDILNFPTYKPYKYLTFPDYECITNKYDAIHLTQNGLIAANWFNSPDIFYGWDCESVLVLNPDVVVQNQ